MAVKKEIPVEAPQEEVKAEGSAEDPWAEEVEVRVPRARAGEPPYYYVCVNDRRYQIPADGRKQKMPRPIAEVLEDSINAEFEADKFQDEVSAEAGMNK